MDTIEQVTSIQRVDPAEWDAVAGDEVFWRHGWLATTEQCATLPNRSRYFIARDGSGIRAAAVCHTQESGESAIGMDRVLFGRFARVARALRFEVAPALICGSRVGVASHVKVRADVAPQERVQTIESMIRCMREHADAERRSLCFRNVTGRDDLLDGCLRARGFARAAEMPGTSMNVTWETFADYVRDLKRTHHATARNIAHELNRARARSVVFRRLDSPGELAPRLHQLLSEHHERLNDTPFPYDASFVRNLCDRLGDRVFFFIAFAGDDPIGVTIGFRDADRMYLPFVGVDDERRKGSFAYFNLAYNEPIRYAIENGVRAIYCGKLVYHVKVRRGFRPLPLYLYVRLRNRLSRTLLRPIAASQIARVQLMVRKYDDARHPEANDPAW